MNKRSIPKQHVKGPGKLPNPALEVTLAISALLLAHLIQPGLSVRRYSSTPQAPAVSLAVGAVSQPSSLAQRRRLGGPGGGKESFCPNHRASRTWRGTMAGPWSQGSVPRQPQRAAALSCRGREEPVLHLTWQLRRGLMASGFSKP